MDVSRTTGGVQSCGVGPSVVTSFLKGAERGCGGREWVGDVSSMSRTCLCKWPKPLTPVELLLPTANQTSGRLQRDLRPRLEQSSQRSGLGNRWLENAICYLLYKGASNGRSVVSQKPYTIIIVIRFQPQPQKGTRSPLVFGDEYVFEARDGASCP